MRKNDVVLLRHMLDAAEEAMGFVRGRKRSDLDQDRQFVLALVKDIEIIGEAAYPTSDETRAKLPDIPWDDIVGMRHRPVHAYFDINLDILWKTVQEDLPLLAERLRAYLSSRE